MGQLIAELQIKRESGMLYYVKSNERGNICVWKARLARGGRKKVIKNAAV